MKRILTTLKEKWPEYILEILVITIGILGAYSLNNWNENRKSKQDERKIISQLIGEYEANLQQLDSKIEIRELMVIQAQTVLDFIDDPTMATYEDVLNNIMLFSNDPTFDPINNDLLSTGNLRILGNDSLRGFLANWEADVAQLNEFESNWQRHTQNFIVPFFVEIGVQRDISMTIMQMPEFRELWDANKSLVDQFISDMGYSNNPPSIEELLTNTTLEGIAVNVIGYNQGSNFQSLFLRKKMVKTLELLRREVE